MQHCSRGFKTCLLPSSLLPSKKSNLVTKLPLLPPANEVWGKVIFSVACVKNSVHGGGGSTWADTPPRAGTPPRQVHPQPPSRYITSPTPGQVHPPGAVHAGKYGQQAGGTHPTGMHSCSPDMVTFHELVQWSQPDLSKNKTKIKHHFVKITSLFSKNKTHFSRTNTHIFLLFLHKIPFTYTVSIPLIKVYNF